MSLNGQTEKAFQDLDLSLKYKVADITLAELGHKDMQLSEREMPGRWRPGKNTAGEAIKGLKIMGSLHMTIQTAMLIDTLYALGADIRWATCNIFSAGSCGPPPLPLKVSRSVLPWKGRLWRISGGVRK
ncbi:MAG: adenosylhomocysteinase [Desulfobacterales bacterium]